MARRSAGEVAAWPALDLEGNLLSPAMIAAIDRREAGEQDETDYGVRKGLTVRDEISLAFRVGQAHYDAFARIAAPSPGATARFVRDFLRETFAFSDIEDGDGSVAMAAGNGRVPVAVVPPTDALDRRSATLSSERPRSATLLLQDRLNASDACLWGLACNGTTLRLMRDNASLTRPTYIEADLAGIFETEDMASFAALWLLIHRSRFGRAGTPPADCALERWREAGSKAGAAARERLAAQVEQALRDLGAGFLEANGELRAKLLAGEIDRTIWFNELLRLVYRLIFLMVAEDRDLLHVPEAGAEARQLYAEGFGVARLREQSVRRAAWDRHHDRYEGMKIVFRALARGEPRLGLPALGGLFADSQLPTLGAVRIANRAFLSALYRLGWLAEEGAMVPINWRAMETEELGSVYESLLELQPQLSDDGRSLVFASDTVETRGSQRKTTGSYYTPDSLVQALLDTALDPVLDRTEAAAADPAEALLALCVIDPACGSGHFLLAAARRIATRIARHRAAGTPSAADFRHALRDVARRCLHGVDRNSMAVELAKVALWIETVDPGLPLGFFESQIRCGDSLLGIFDLAVLQKGIPDAAYKPLAGDDKETARHYAKRNRSEREGQGSLDFAIGGGRLPAARHLADLGGALRALPETTLAEVEAKRARYQALHSGATWYAVKLGCDAYVAAFLVPKTGGVPANRNTTTIPTSSHLWEALAGRQIYGPLAARIDAVANAARAFHWPLEFPDVMAKGGFDVVLGNPPWEVMQLSEKEYFAASHPEIANLVGTARKKAIEDLARTSPATFDDYQIAKRRFDGGNEFARASGRFDMTARGKVNTYALFAELFAVLVGPKGRAGVILPTGIATDSATAPFFAWLVESNRLARLVAFENEESIFPSVHHAFKFALLTLSSSRTERPQFCFFLRRTTQIDEAERNFVLLSDQIARLNPNTRTAPVFRSRADAELTAKIYANVPVLVDETKGAAGNPWRVEFRQGLFNMTSESHLFRKAAQLAAAGFLRDGPDWVAEGIGPRQSTLPAKGRGTGNLPGGGPHAPQRYVPLYEAKMIHQFDHRWAGYAEDGESSIDVARFDKQNPAFEPVPRYWVPEAEVSARLMEKGWTRQWLMGWRDIARATDERTVISTVFPRVGTGDTLLLEMPSGQDARSYAASVGNLCAFVLDYASRQKVGGTHLKYNVFKQLPILPPVFYTEPRLTFLVPKVLELIYTSHALTPFARDLGHDGPPFCWDEDRRAHLRADLDAFYARAYGLTRDELRYIIDPADVRGPNYPSETFRVLKQREIRLHGEYLTARLVLAAWDRMEVDGTFKAMAL